MRFSRLFEGTGSHKSCAPYVIVCAVIAQSFIGIGIPVEAQNLSKNRAALVIDSPVVTSTIGQITTPSAVVISTPVATPMPTTVFTGSPTTTPATTTFSIQSVTVATRTLGIDTPSTIAYFGIPIRLKITVAITNAPTSGVPISATWQLGSVLSFSQAVTIPNGISTLYDSVTIPARGFQSGRYRFTGSITYAGTTQRLSTVLTVLAPPIPAVRSVHYAHLHIVVPAGWTVDLSTNGDLPATGVDTLVMFSASRRAAVSVVSVALSKRPSSSDLRALAPTILKQEFGNATHVKLVRLSQKIGGHVAYGSRGTVSLAGLSSTATAVVTAKGRQFYAFTTINVLNRASPKELRAAQSAIYRSRLD